MNRYCYNAETTDINEWLTAAHKLRNLIDEGTRGAVDVHEESWYIQKKAHCHLIGTPSDPVAVMQSRKILSKYLSLSLRKVSYSEAG